MKIKSIHLALFNFSILLAPCMFNCDNILCVSRDDRLFDINRSRQEQTKVTRRKYYSECQPKALNQIEDDSDEENYEESDEELS